MLSGGTAFFSFVTLNDVICASNLIIWFILEIYSDYALVSMMIERCIVVYFPLQAKSILNTRFTIILICVWIVPLWLALVPISPFICGVQYGSRWSQSGMFCGWYPDRPGFLYFLWAYQLIIYTLHVIFSGILVIALFIGIAYRHQIRRKLILRDKEASGQESRNREYSAIVVMLLISCINLVIFIPGLVSMLISYLVDTSSWSLSSQITLANFSRFAFSIPCVAKSFNFIVYFCRIPTFRTEIANFFSCCLAK